MRYLIHLLIFIIGLTIWCDCMCAQTDQSFLRAPKLIEYPSQVESYQKESRKFTGIPSLAITPKGRYWAVWYTGNTASEDENNYVILATSQDQGETWKEILAVDPDEDGPVRAFDPQIWIDPEENLWVFWAQAIGHDGTIAGVWSISTSEINLEQPHWSAPKRLTDGIMMCKPLVLSTGEWALPASTWKLTDHSAKFIVSSDEGKTWLERGAVNVPKEVRSFDEHNIIEKKDGSIWMFVRTNYGIGESTSLDRGKSWSTLNPSEIKHPSARFFMRHLSSGNLLLVKHGPLDIRTGRSHLMAFLSKDDGKSWTRGLLLDQRQGVSYPDGQQLPDGRIFIIYDFNRTKEQNVLMTSFSEEDLLSPDYDKKMVEIFDRRKTINKAENN